MSFSGLVKAYSVPSWRNTSYCSGVNWLFHSASVLITFLIPLDFVPSPFASGLGCGLTANAPFNIFSLDCAQPGSRDNNATPPSAIEDEIKKRLFIICSPDYQMPKNDIRSYLLNSNYVRGPSIGFKMKRKRFSIAGNLVHLKIAKPFKPGLTMNFGNEGAHL